MKAELRKGIWMVCVCIAAVACRHDKNNPAPANSGNNNNGSNNGGNSGNNNNNNDTGLCFERDILPIFVSNCAKAGCHDATTQQDGFRFTDYNSIVAKDFVAGNAAATELYEKITEDKPSEIMPPAPATPLTAAQVDLIGRWINEGAKNTTGCGTLCDSNNYAYAANVQPIFDKYCKGCHSGAAAPKGIMLDSYTGVKTAASGGRLLGSIKRSTGYTPMPQGGNKLSDCEMAQVEKWINAGTPNN